MPAQENLDASIIKELTAEIQNLTRAIGGLGGIKEADDLSSQIADMMQEQYETLKKQADEQGKTLDIYAIMKDAAQKAVKQEKEIGNISNEMLQEMESALKAAKGQKGFYGKLDPIQKKIIKALGSQFLLLDEQKRNALKIAKTDITGMLRKLETMGFMGKIAKYVGTAFVGEEGSKKRKGVEEQLAAKMHPDLFPGTKTGGMADLISGFSKFAAIASIIYTVLKAIFDNLMKIAEVPAKLVKTTGFTADNIEKMAGSVIKSSVELKYFGIEMDQIYEAAGSLAKEFKNVDQTSGAARDTVTIMSKMTGIASDQLARVYRIMAVNWRMADKSIRSFTLKLRDEAKIYGLSFNGIMQDIAANAENLSMYFHGSVEALKQAAVRAAQMQTSLSTQVTMTQKFSHWADAIQNSFMLSAITGKQFAASSLYIKAAMGDTKGVVDEILSGLTSSAETWQKIVPMAQQVSETLGVPFEEIRTMMENKTIEKMLSGLGISAQQMGHAVKAVREIATKKYDGNVRKATENLGSNMSELTEIMSKSMQKEKDLAAARDETAINQAEIFAAKLGLPEIMSPQEKILSTIGGIANEILTTLTNVIAPALEPLANIFQKIGLSQSGGTAKQGEVPGWQKALGFLALGPVALVAEKMKHGADDTMSKGFKKPTLETKQMGGTTTTPSIVSEFGQKETVLPHSGPGKGAFTEPFLAANVIEPFAREIKEAIMSMTRIPLEVKVYLDSEVLAEKIEHYTYQQSTR